MASLKEIRGRMGSVSSTLKITSAMRLIASAKLHSAQNAIGNMVPYEHTLRGVFQNLVAGCPSALEEYLPAPQNASPEDAKRPWAVVCVTSNQNLCGSFNSSILKAFFEDGHPVESTIVYCVGKYGWQRLSKLGYKTVDCCDMAGKANYDKSAALASRLMEDFKAGKIAGVKIVYSHFVSAISQTVQRDTFLPFNAEAQTSYTGGFSENYITEPDAKEMIGLLLPQVQVLAFHTVMLDSAAAEHAARSQAMQVATDNAESLLSELSLLYNKLRQQAITNEILDLASGSAEK